MMKGLIFCAITTLLICSSADAKNQKDSKLPYRSAVLSLYDNLQRERTMLSTWGYTNGTLQNAEAHYTEGEAQLAEAVKRHNKVALSSQYDLLNQEMDYLKIEANVLKKENK